MNQTMKISSPTNDYVLYEKILGRGSYGVVLYGKQVSTLKSYAIKINRKLELDRICGADNVRQEILLQTKLNHKNIVQLIETFEDENYLYLILEYCGGGSLYKHLKMNGPFSENEAFKYFIQILQGIQFLHSKGIVHRDIKLENILLNDDGVVKICDFNWAVQLSKYGIAEGMVCGTLEYMPPEVMLKKQQTNKLDIWSLGVLLYELLHQQLPFKNTKVLEISDSISDDCKQLLKQMMSIDQFKRPSIKQILQSSWVKRHADSCMIFNHRNYHSAKTSLMNYQSFCLTERARTEY